jgi:hypothetical protein
MVCNTYTITNAFGKFGKQCYNNNFAESITIRYFLQQINNMRLNFDTLTEERQNELKEITGTQILAFIISNLGKGLSPQDLLTKCSEYANTPEELAYIVYLVTGASVSARFI